MKLTIIAEIDGEEEIIAERENDNRQWLIDQVKFDVIGSLNAFAQSGKFCL